MYIGPETLMPLASAVAAVMGVLLMFWRRVVGAVRSGVNTLSRLFTRLASRD